MEKTNKNNGPVAKRANPRQNEHARIRGQTAIEYVLMISATVVFISLTAFFIKTRVIAP
ncbi:hypothetical protein HY994_02850 [Candidatus Micrarchaeota archaeon]|nr:hypothetical protein [Candidatus Micrarchaeota archaeon]